MDTAERVRTRLEKHPAIRSVRLVGSRQRGDAVELSDWDFEVDVTDFYSVVRDLPAMVARLHPISQMWDPLSHHANYMLILRGPIKIDLLFRQCQQKAPPWTVSGETLQAISDHFWDWILWIASKRSRHRHETVDEELKKIATHLLRPMGVAETPESIDRAVKLFKAASLRLENQLSVHSRKELETEVLKALGKAGNPA